MADDVFQHSIVVDEELVAASGCFTTLPVRDNARNDIVEEATLNLADEWHQMFGEESPGC